MSYPQSSSNPPQVLTHLKTMWHNEQDAFPSQLAEAKQWTSRAEAKLEAEITNLEAKGKDYLRGNPRVAEQLRKLKEELEQLKERGETGLNRLLHPGDSHPLPPNELHSLEHYGAGRIATNYGADAAASAAAEHARIRGSARDRW
ncbi:hypothetical protein JCM3765_001292 [Sporobolomyces pararoseus]